MLWLNDTRVTDVGVSCLSRQKGLQEVWLGGTKVGDAGYALIVNDSAWRTTIPTMGPPFGTHEWTSVRTPGCARKI